MKKTKLAIFMALISLGSAGISSCQDDVSPIGGSVTNGEVVISVDSAAFKFDSRTVPAMDIDARSTTNLLGHINIPEYGDLSASYVTQLLSASQMLIPDSIGVDRVDSLRVVMGVRRANAIGDTLAPQQFKMYNLTKSLPSDIRSHFDPAGYYDPKDAIATKNYTLSGIALTDTAFRENTVLMFGANLPKQWGVDLFNAYRKDPEAFQWPETLQKYFKGFYVEPSFGRGAIANVGATAMYLFYHHFETKNVVEDEVSVKKQITVRDSVCLLGSAPEVVSSTVFRYTPSRKLLDLIAEGKQIVTAPLGYHVNFKFPAEKLLEEYWASDVNLTLINNLTLAIPATAVRNDYGLLPPPNLLMIRSDKVDEFFSEGRVPDNKTSFTGSYSSTNGRYEFSSMREYIVGLKDQQGSLKEEEMDFVLIPVQIESEKVTDYYGNVTTYVTNCVPYIQRPAIAELHTDRAQVVFTFTKQLMK